jgi:hypothetical protein
LKIVDENEIFNKDSYINIPEIFISGLRTNPSKAKNLNEYWKDICLIENLVLPLRRLLAGKCTK